MTTDRLLHWMNLAKCVENLENPCYSKKIGAIVIDPVTDSLVSIGHNGPPRGCPPNDDLGYLQNVFWPKLNDREKEIVGDIKLHENCKICPRRLINVQSGERLELCSCAHAESNAIVNAHRSLVGCWMICHCGCPCAECCKVIVGAGITKVVCVKREKDYSPYLSRWILDKAGVSLLTLEQ